MQAKVTNLERKRKGKSVKRGGEPPKRDFCFSFERLQESQGKRKRTLRSEQKQEKGDLRKIKANL